MNFSCPACCNDYGGDSKSFDIWPARQCKASGIHLDFADICQNFCMSHYYKIQREKLVARETAFEKEFKHSTSFSEERYSTQN